MHVHFHVIPRYDDASPASRSGSGLGIKWNAGKLDPAIGSALAREIASRLG
jgi:diadenosine tetraphosphate (Ap4A) HIT family hydrolase